MKDNIQNYDRYNTMNEHSYNKKGISYYLMRRPGDKLIFPFIDELNGKDILEVGAGYGYYTWRMNKKNKVEVTDINIDLCEGIDVPVKYCCSADKLTDHIVNRYDYIVSFWMTEYLDKEQLGGFITQGRKLLKPGGILLTTVIENRGIG